MIISHSLRVTLFLSAAFPIWFNSDGFASAQSALRQRGIVTDSQTAAKMVQNPALMKAYQSVQHLNIPAQDYVKHQDQLPAGTSPQKIAAIQYLKDKLAVPAPNAAEILTMMYLQTDPAGNLGGIIKEPTIAEFNAATKLKAVLIHNFTKEQLKATMLLKASQYGAGAIVGPTAAQIDAVTSAAAAGADVQKEMAWAMQNGGGMAPKGVAQLRKKIGGGPVTHYDFEILWKEPALGAWTAAARLFDGAAGFGHAGTTGFRVTAAAAAGLRLNVGDLVVFNQLTNSGADVDSVAMTAQRQHP